MIKYIKSLSQLIPGVVALCILSGCTSCEEVLLSLLEDDDDYRFNEDGDDFRIFDDKPYKPDRAERHREQREARKQAEHIRDYESQRRRNKK